MNKAIAAIKWSLEVVRVEAGFAARLALRTGGQVIAYVDLSPFATMLLSKALIEYALAACNGLKTQGTTIGKPTPRTLGQELLATQVH